MIPQRFDSFFCRPETAATDREERFHQRASIMLPTAIGRRQPLLTLEGAEDARQLLPASRTTKRQVDQKGKGTESPSPPSPWPARREAPEAAPRICRRRRSNLARITSPRSFPAFYHGRAARNPASDRLIPRHSTKPGDSPKPPPTPLSTVHHPFSPSPPRQARKRRQRDITKRIQ
jgi:hypothetical protein